MNENAKKLYEDLKEGRLPQFDMASWCGSAHCIGGEAMLRAYNSGVPDSGSPYSCSKNDQIATEFLGLDAQVAQQLFYPPDDEEELPKGSPWGFLAIGKDSYDATQQQAAEALKRACELSEAQ